MSNVIRTPLFLAVLFLISACATTSSNISIDEESAARNMDSLSSIEVGDEIYYPASETDTEPELKSDRDYLTESIGSRGSGQQVVKRKASETVRYGLMINKKGRVVKMVPLEVSVEKIPELRESYKRASFEPATRNGEPVNSYVIISEQF